MHLFYQLTNSELIGIAKIYGAREVALHQANQADGHIIDAKNKPDYKKVNTNGSLNKT